MHRQIKYTIHLIYNRVKILTTSGTCNIFPAECTKTIFIGGWGFPMRLVKRKCWDIWSQLQSTVSQPCTIKVKMNRYVFIRLLSHFFQTTQPGYPRLKPYAFRWSKKACVLVTVLRAPQTEMSVMRIDLKYLDIIQSEQTKNFNLYT